MTHFLASEGGYQSFVLTSTEKVWLVIVLVTAVFGLLVGLGLMRGVLAADQGTPKMREIAAAIQEGAVAFLRRQFRAIAFMVVPLAILIFFTATKVVRPGGHVALSFGAAGGFRVLCFLFGAALSGLTGFIGMSLAVRGNVRTAAAARGGKLPGALKVAFRTGAITGMLCVGLGLLGATIIVFAFQNTATAVLVGFGFGASLIALFMRVGGGIFTKAADVGADLVGKVEAGIPEDDPRNAATIADNVGDNVGDCAGMAADLFESYEITIIAAADPRLRRLHLARRVHRRPLGARRRVPAHRPRHRHRGLSRRGLRGAGAGEGPQAPWRPINRGFWLAAVLTIFGTFFVAQFYVHYMKAFYAVLTGVVLVLVASQITEHFTSPERNPVREIAEAARTGPATTVLAGISHRASSRACGRSSPSPSPSASPSASATATSSSRCISCR